MSGYKNFIVAIICTACLACCKAPSYQFSTKAIVSNDLRNNIAAAIKPGVADSIISVSIFKASIREKLVESDAVAEYKLVNSLSNRKTVDLEINRYYNELYFFELESVNEQYYGIYLAATFEASGKCIGIGPLYIGFVGIGDSNSRKFITEKEYAIKKDGNSIRLKEIKPAQQLVFVYQPILKENGQPAQINVFQIIQKSRNKISGLNKPLVYDITRIFNDDRALAFSVVNDQ